jgi:NADH:ubiquinone oxidoreductase subunit F (NADH-binding)
VGAPRALIVIAEDERAVRQTVARAIAERAPEDRIKLRILEAPAHYVAGESSAVVNFVNTGFSLPVTVPPRPYQKGVEGRPTLVQNVETLAHAALVARFGAGWFRSAGGHGGHGTVLLTVHSAGREASVIEVEAGSTVGAAIEQAGGSRAGLRAVLLGGYFGSWLGAEEGWSTRILPSRDSLVPSLGAGIIVALPENRCGVCETAQVMRYLAGQSSAQCGPCFFGLRALADACERISGGRSEGNDVKRLQRWSGEVRGRGACHHPDGAAGFLQSALATFGDEFQYHPRHAPQGRWL